MSLNFETKICPYYAMAYTCHIIDIKSLGVVN